MPCICVFLRYSAKQMVRSCRTEYLLPNSTTLQSTTRKYRNLQTLRKARNNRNGKIYSELINWALSVYLISLNLSLFHIDLSDQLPKISEPEMNEQTVIQKLMYFCVARSFMLFCCTTQYRATFEGGFL